MRARRSIVISLLATAGLVGAPSPALAVDVAFPTEQESEPYSPSQVELAAPGSVTFTGGFANHPLKWVTNDFSLQSDGTTRTYAFANPGMFRFICDFHPDMYGYVHVAGNQFASAQFNVSPAAPVTDTTVTFDASALVDPDGSIASYEWDLDGDGAFGTKGLAAKVTKAYTRAGTVKVGLRYVDSGHETSPASSATSSWRPRLLVAALDRAAAPVAAAAEQAAAEREAAEPAAAARPAAPPTPRRRSRA